MRNIGKIFRGRGRRLGSVLAVAALAACVAGGARAQAAMVPVAVDAHWTEGEKGAVLTFDLSTGLTAEAFAMADPNRIVVDIPETNFQIDSAVGRNAPAKARLIKAFRFGQLAPGKSRIVIDLAGAALVAKIAVTPVAPDSAAARLEISLEPCDPSAFAAAVKAATAQRDASPPAPARAPAKDASPLPVIVLDPGHGGIDGGANGPAGVVEKALTLDFAAELARQLEKSGKLKVVMTRSGDDFVSLDERVKIARDANAAFLISIHADTLADSANVSGATVYTVADRASDAESARIAERENAADKAAGIERKADEADVSDILFDLRRRESRTYGRLFSRDVVKSLAGVAKLNRNPERAARFVVLKAPDFPSVLIELGYLSSPSDVKAMGSPEWRARAAAAVAASVTRFFAPKGEPDAAPQLGAAGAPPNPAKSAPQ